MSNKKVKDEVVRECYKCKSIITLIINNKSIFKVGKFLCDKCFMKELEIKYNKTYESLKIMKDKYKEKCKDCEKLAYMNFKRQCVIDELTGNGDEE